MGCDIHLFVEKKNNNKWEAVKGKNPYFGCWANEPEECYKDWFYNSRNYSLFSVLADVRNNYNIKPIATPKGLPIDVSDIVRKESDEWDGDGHSHSWLTLKELLDYDINQTITAKGMISPAQYSSLQQGINPSSWCGWTSQEDYISAKWEEKLNDFVGFFWTENIPQLQALTNNPEDIRIVFWFDN